MKMLWCFDGDWGVFMEFMWYFIVFYKVLYGGWLYFFVDYWLSVYDVLRGFILCLRCVLNVDSVYKIFFMFVGKF